MNLQSEVHVSYQGNGKQLKAAKMRFSAFQCFAFDDGAADISCLRLLGHHLLAKPGNIALAGTGPLFSYLLKHVPELRAKIACVIADEKPAADFDRQGIDLVSLADIPASVGTVFLCETKTFPRWRMRKLLPAGLDVVCPDILTELDWQALPERAWVPHQFSIYPIDVPDIEFKKGLDAILIDVPARNLALMPNGLAYVHNAMKKEDVTFQTVDTDIIIYHRYHVHRLFDLNGEVHLPSGKQMPVDPWQAENYELWTNAETVEYFRPEIDAIVAKLIEAKPKILGISLQQCNEVFAREIVNGVRAGHPDVVVVVGGFSCYNADIGRKAFPESDYMCIGEADLTVGPLFVAILSGKRPFNVPGVLSRFDTPEYRFILGPMPHNLDGIAYPDYEWCDISLYRNFNNYQLTPILASRGCRWSRCTFCAERFYWRIRSAENFVDELEWLVSKGCYLFMFNESDLNGMPEKLLEICDEIIRRKLPVKMAGQLRIHKRNDRPFFDKLKQAGVIALRFGVDAFSEGTLKLQRKGYTTETISQNLKDCTEAGIYTEVNWVVGVPGETDEDIEEGIDLILANKPYIGRLANINTLVLANGSVYWLDPESHNIVFHEDKDDIYTNHCRAIPEGLWHSEQPYIDGAVRRKRFSRIIRRLNEAGFDIGAWAHKVIDDTMTAAKAEAGDTAEAEAAPAPAPEPEAPKAKPEFQANSMVASEPAPTLDRQITLYRFDKSFYGLPDGDLADTFDEGILTNARAASIIWAEDHDATPQFIAVYGQFNLIEYKGRFHACPHGLMAEWPKVEAGIYPDVITRDNYADLCRDVAEVMLARGVDLRPPKSDKPKVLAAAAQLVASEGGEQILVRPFGDYDIYVYEGIHYGIPRSMGKIRLDKVDPTTVPEIITDTSIDTVESEIGKLMEQVNVAE